MRAGELKHKIKIEEPVYGRDAAGGKTITWTEVCDVWAAIEPLKGREYIETQKVASEITVRIRIRHRDDIEPHMRVTHIAKSIVYEIVAVIPVREHGEELHLMCKRVV
jgi:SPP1 family predicted phage head-tail adaptor